MSRTTESIPVWNGEINLDVQIRGAGPALIYFHPAAGMAWDPFLEQLARRFTIYAPEFPGTSVGNPYAIHHVHDLSEAVMLYEEALRKLGLGGAPAIGQSFGGMLALELAAAYPGIFTRLVVLDPIGLWSENAPVANWMERPIEELPALLFKNPESVEAKAALALPAEREPAIKACRHCCSRIPKASKPKPRSRCPPSPS
jgi:pimeloyl-ACP methyl ester carboxylesterase